MFERPTYRTQITEEDDRNLPKRVLQVLNLSFSHTFLWLRFLLCFCAFFSFNFSFHPFVQCMWWCCCYIHPKNMKSPLIFFSVYLFFAIIFNPSTLVLLQHKRSEKYSFWHRKLLKACKVIIQVLATPFVPSVGLTASAPMQRGSSYSMRGIEYLL